MSEWEEFVFTADEFLAAHVSTPALARATPYLLGHAIELYLKAAYVIHFGAGKNLEELKREFQSKFNRGHGLKALWDALKELDGFMPDHIIREDLYPVPYPDEGIKRGLPEEALSHLGENYEWYFVFRHHNALRYPLERIESYFFSSRGAFWLKFFKDLRGFLGYPGPDKKGHLSQIIRQGFLPADALEYLKLIDS
jgi:hypothetical protein